jgi:hypothetical protein
MRKDETGQAIGQSIIVEEAVTEWKFAQTVTKIKRIISCK